MSTVRIVVEVGEATYEVEREYPDVQTMSGGPSPSLGLAAVALKTAAEEMGDLLEARMKRAAK